MNTVVILNGILIYLFNDSISSIDWLNGIVSLFLIIVFENG